MLNKLAVVTQPHGKFCVQGLPEQGMWRWSQGWDGADCTSKEAAAEISTGTSALHCPPLHSQRRNRNQNALGGFSGLADAKRQRWCSLAESECFYSEGGRGAFPLSLALRKTGKCYCAGK